MHERLEQQIKVFLMNKIPAAGNISLKKTLFYNPKN